MEADFTGYATRANIRCTDGRTITPDAFKHQDKIQVPLVWQHQHDSPDNILGYAVLEHRDEDHAEGPGIYCYGYFNDTPAGVTTKALVEHGDVKALSIYAGGLVEKAKTVLHGAINEVSVVLKGANKGSFIDNVRIAHSDGDIETLEDQAVIYLGSLDSQSSDDLSHDDSDDDSSSDDDNDDDTTMADVYERMSDQEKEVVHYMIGAALDQAGSNDDDDADQGVQHSADSSDEDPDEDDDDDNDNDDDTDDEGDLSHKEGDDMSRNLFDQNGGGSTMTGIDTSKRLTHSELSDIVKEAKRPNGSFKEAVLAHAETYGITNIELLFPDAKAIEATPQFISRRMEWVATVINGTKHSPIAVVKTLLADITKEEARAKGYIKGNRKEEEVFELLARTTRPSTIYKKQKLDRDDLLDITDINVVSWLKAEMRLMIEEELARAILVGDGRPANHPDKIKDPAGAIDGVGIRSIYKDDDLYAIKVPLASNVDSKSAVKALVRAMDDYRGSGAPTMFIARNSLTDMMLDEDKFGRPLYANKGELADKIGVSNITTVDLFTEYDGLFAIIVALGDYQVGTNKGGELTSFEDFDIDFNQYKYLQETRLSGGLTKPFSALVVTRAQGQAVSPTSPSFNGATKTITIPEQTGVVYYIDSDEVDGDVVINTPTEVTAGAAPGYFIPSGTNRTWSYQV